MLNKLVLSVVVVATVVATLRYLIPAALQSMRQERYSGEKAIHDYKKRRDHLVRNITKTILKIVAAQLGKDDSAETIPNTEITQVERSLGRINKFMARQAAATAEEDWVHEYIRLINIFKCRMPGDIFPKIQAANLTIEKATQYDYSYLDNSMRGYQDSSSKMIAELEELLAKLDNIFLENSPIASITYAQQVQQIMCKS